MWDEEDAAQNSFEVKGNVALATVFLRSMDWGNSLVLTFQPCASNESVRNSIAKDINYI